PLQATSTSSNKAIANALPHASSALDHRLAGLREPAATKSHQRSLALQPGKTRRSREARPGSPWATARAVVCPSDSCRECAAALQQFTAANHEFAGYAVVSP